MNEPTIFKKCLTGIIALLCVGSAACAGNATAKEEVEEKGQVITLTDSAFRARVFDYQANLETWEYLGDKPAIIDFYADWCGPCRAIAPILKELAQEFKDSIIIYKVNVDKEKELAGWAGIQSIPAILFIPMDEKPQMLVGQQPKETFVKIIRKFLLKQETPEESAGN